MAAAWNWISVPPPPAYRDTLSLRVDGHVRLWKLPRPYFYCPDGPEVELVYARSSP